MPIEDAHMLLREDIEFQKNRLIRKLKESDPNRAQNVKLTQQEFDALILIGFNVGNVSEVYELLLSNNRDRNKWREKWESTDKREDIAFDMFFNGNY